MPYRLIVWVLGLAYVCALAPATPGQAETATPLSAIACPATSKPMAQLELVFGMSRHDAPPVSDAEWQDFVDAQVTPRFPDGLTILQGYGQWRNRAGAIVKEASRLLLIWYERGPDSDTRIEAIRDAYKARFKQESVLRADSLSCVSF